MKSSFCAQLSHCFSIYKKQLFTSVSVASIGFLPRRFVASVNIQY